MGPGASASGAPIQLSGRTWCDRIGVPEGHERPVGSFLPVEVDDAAGKETLFGHRRDGGNWRPWVNRSGSGTPRRATIGEGRDGLPDGRARGSLKGTSPGSGPALRPDLTALAGPWPGSHAGRRSSWAEVIAGEWRHGFALPRGPEALALALLHGLFADGPLIHPLSAIGPMVPFARVPGLMVQPESWVRAGQSERRDRLPRPGLPLAGRGLPRVHVGRATIGGRRPRLIAPRLDAWFLLASWRRGGREYWSEIGKFADLGDPWEAHRRNVPAPGLSDRLLTLAERVSPLVHAGIDDRAIAARFGISPFDVEAIVRHVQHARPAAVRVGGEPGGMG